MKSVTITLDDEDKITLQSKDFGNDIEELFHVLATSTRRVAQMIENKKE